MQTIFDIYVSLIGGLLGLFNYDYTGVFGILKPISFLLSLVFAFFIVWSIVRFGQVMKIIKGSYAPESHWREVDKSPELQRKAYEGWQKILEKGKSLDENERKFALIEADTLLDKILSLSGYNGENLGERLKKVEKGDIESLDDIWEAHKIRNRIAHEANFRLSSETTELVLSRFEKALRELGYI